MSFGLLHVFHVELKCLKLNPLFNPRGEIVLIQLFVILPVVGIEPANSDWFFGENSLWIVQQDIWRSGSDIRLESAPVYFCFFVFWGFMAYQPLKVI